MTELLNIQNEEKQPKRGVALADTHEPTMATCEEENSQEGDDGLVRSLRTIFANQNYTVFLATSWVFSTFSYLAAYLNLYLRILGWSILTIGAVMSIIGAMSSISRLIGGYIGDISNRKRIAVAAQLVLGIYYIYVGLFVDFVLIFIALMIYSVHDLFKSGSSAFIMENVPQEHSGFAISLFTAGRGFSILGLIAFGLLEPVMGFPEAFRVMYFITGLCLIISSIGRSILLEPQEVKCVKREKTIISEFLSENVRAARLLLASIPGLVLVVVLDSLSDSFFKFSALIYAYEELSIDIAGINLMLVTQLLISVPLLLKMGRTSDRKGVKRAAFTVYCIMPISAGLLFIAPIIPYVMPAETILAIDNIAPGLSVLFSTPFIGIVLKYVNDSLWWGLIIILIRKRLPKTDTAKILSIFWVIVYVLASVGPVIAGIIYTFMTPSILFLTIIVLNVVILGAISKGPFGNGPQNNDTIAPSASPAHD